MTNKYIKRTQGFTLVELSIVIIIIGFLIAGIAAGQSLIKQAKLNSIITDFNTFENALNTFKVRYSELPGDMTDASAYWPNCDPTPANCNGNGNGIIEYEWWQTPSTIENYRAWQELSLSGILAGSYTGVGGPPGYQALVGINTPPSKYTENAGYYLAIDGTGTATEISMGKEVNGIENSGSSMPPVDAYLVDNRIDDGIANTGIIVTYGGQNSGGSPWDTQCVSGGTYLNLDVDTIHCVLAYVYK